MDNITNSKSEADHFNLDDRGVQKLDTAIEKCKKASKLITRHRSISNVLSSLQFYINAHLLLRLKKLEKHNYDYMYVEAFNKAWYRNLKFDTLQILQSFLDDINSPNIKYKKKSNITLNFLNNIVFDSNNLNIILKHNDKNCLELLFQILVYTMENNISNRLLPTIVQDKCKGVVKELNKKVQYNKSIKPTNILKNDIKNKCDNFIKAFNKILQKNLNKLIEDKLLLYVKFINEAFNKELNQIDRSPLDYYFDKLYS